MSPTEEILRLDDLATRADVPVRTVRYYLQVGLLEAPPFRGRDTSYPASAVNRLKAIRQLRARLLPLDRIAVLLEPLTPEQVALVAEGLLSIDPSGRLLLLGSGAPDASPPVRIIDPFATSKSPDTTPGREKSPPAPVADAKGGARAKKKESAESSTWRRTALAPGVELHVDAEALLASGRAKGHAGAARLAARLEQALRAVLDAAPSDESEASRP